MKLTIILDIFILERIFYTTRIILKCDIMCV